MVQNGVKMKTFMNETVLNIMFHVDLWMLKYISHLQCFVATKNRLKHEKNIGKRCSGARFYFNPTWPFTTSRQPVAALISTAGEPSSGGPQTTFTVNHKPNPIL